MNGSFSSLSLSRAAVPAVAAIVAAVLGLVNLFSALTAERPLGADTCSCRSSPDRRHACVPCARCACVGRAPCRRVLPSSAPSRRVADGARPALRPRGPRHRQRSRCRGGSPAPLRVAALLWWGRSAFNVRGDPVRLRSAAWRVPAIAVTTIFLGLIAVGRSPRRTPGANWFDETLDLLAWQPGRLRLGDEGGHLPLAVGLLGLAAARLRCLARVSPRGGTPCASRPGGPAQAVGELVRRHGNDTLSFISSSGRTIAISSPRRTAEPSPATAPRAAFCSSQAIPSAPSKSVCRSSCERCAPSPDGTDSRQLPPSGTSEQLLPLWREAGFRRALRRRRGGRRHRTAFSLEGRGIRKVRQSVSRLERAGFRANEPADLPIALRWRPLPRARGRLRAPGEAGAPERGFTMAMDSSRAARAATTGLVVARSRRRRTQARGFLHFVPVYGPAGHVPLLAHAPAIARLPDGLTEFLVARIHRALCVSEEYPRSLAEFLPPSPVFYTVPVQPRRAAARPPRVGTLRPVLPDREPLPLQRQVLRRAGNRATLLYEGRLGSAGRPPALAGGQIPKPLA